MPNILVKINEIVYEAGKDIPTSDIDKYGAAGTFVAEPEIVCCKPSAQIKVGRKKAGDKEYLAQGNIEGTFIRMISKDGLNWKYIPKDANTQLVQAFANFLSCCIAMGPQSPLNIRNAGFDVNEAWRTAKNVGTTQTMPDGSVGNYECALSRDEMKSVLLYLSNICQSKDILKTMGKNIEIKAVKDLELFPSGKAVDTVLGFENNWNTNSATVTKTRLEYIAEIEKKFVESVAKETGDSRPLVHLVPIELKRLIPEPTPGFVENDVFRKVYMDIWNKLKINQKVPAYANLSVGKACDMYLSGPAGTGKSAILEEVAARLGIPFVSHTFNQYSDYESVFGRNIIKGDGTLEYEESDISKILKSIGIIEFSEFNLAPSNTQQSIAANLCESPYAMEINGSTTRRNLNSFICPTSNVNYEGSFKSNSALLSRFKHVYVPYDKTNLIKILESKNIIMAETYGHDTSDSRELAQKMEKCYSKIVNYLKDEGYEQEIDSLGGSRQLERAIEDYHSQILYNEEDYRMPIEYYVRKNTQDLVSREMNEDAKGEADAFFNTIYDDTSDIVTIPEDKTKESKYLLLTTSSGEKCYCQFYYSQGDRIPNVGSQILVSYNKDGKLKTTSCIVEHVTNETELVDENKKTKSLSKQNEVSFDQVIFYGSEKAVSKSESKPEKEKQNVETQKSNVEDSPALKDAETHQTIESESIPSKEAESKQRSDNGLNENITLNFEDESLKKDNSPKTSNPQAKYNKGDDGQITFDF